MVRQSKVHRNAFFVEILAAILFFSISMTVILQLFAAADRKSRESAELTMAVLLAQDAVERVKSAKSIQEAGQRLEEARQEENSWILEYDEDWARFAGKDPQYFVVVTILEESSQAGRLAQAKVSVQKQMDGEKQELYQLDGKAYQGEAGS